MSKIALFLFVFIIPFLGFSQSARKINKALKSNYAVQLQVYDSLMKQHDSILPIYTSLNLTYNNKLYEIRDHQDRLRDKKQLILNTYNTLIQLDVSKSLNFTFQSLDSIMLSKYAELNASGKSKSFNMPSVVSRKDWTLQLDDLSIKEQNGHITIITNEIKEINSKITQTNLELAEWMLKLVEKQHELDEIGRYLNSTDELLTEKMTYLFEQKMLARTNFSTKGPKGFNESYFAMFPDVFPELNPAVLHLESAGNGQEFGMKEKNKEPQRLENLPGVFTYVDEPATFNGNLVRYLSDNIHYPCIIPELGISGKCYLQFIVTAAGEITHVTIKRGIADCKECDDELVRVVKGMPKWNPAKNAGIAVNSVFTLPVVFKLP